MPPAPHSHALPDGPAPKHTVRCSACDHRFDVSPKALTLRCPRCTAPMSIGDVVLTAGACCSMIQAVGQVFIGPFARFKGRVLRATGAMRVEGRVETSEASCGETFTLVSGSRWKGNCRAPRMIVEEGAVIDGGFFRVGENRDSAALDPGAQTSEEAA